jgi:hypothetical protein
MTSVDGPAVRGRRRVAKVGGERTEPRRCRHPVQHRSRCRCDSVLEGLQGLGPVRVSAEVVVEAGSINPAARVVTFADTGLAACVGGDTVVGTAAPAFVAAAVGLDEVSTALVDRQTWYLGTFGAGQHGGPTALHGLAISGEPGAIRLTGHHPSRVGGRIVAVADRQNLPRLVGRLRSTRGSTPLRPIALRR